MFDFSFSQELLGRMAWAVLKDIIPYVAIGDFLWEFGIRMAVIILIFVFLLQLVRVAEKIWKSKAVRWILGACAKVINRIAGASPAIAKIVKVFVWMGLIIKIAFNGFHTIEEGDTPQEAGKKIRANYLRGLVYDIADYWLSIACALMVSQLNDWNWKFLWIFVATWVFDIICCVISIVGCLKSKQDLTLGEAHRRAFEAVWAQSRIAGIIYKVIQHPMAVIWDGPEQLVFFYKKELKGFIRTTGATVYLTFAQGAFWAWLYSLGHESVTELLKSFF